MQMWSFIIGIYVVRTFVGQLMFCAVMNLINNSVDVYNMGAANGLGTCVASRRAVRMRERASDLLGAGQSLVAGLRAIGPYFSSVRRRHALSLGKAWTWLTSTSSLDVLMWSSVQVMFAWSMTSGMVFPFNFYFVFVLMSVITVFILGLSFLLQPSLNMPKPMTAAVIPPPSAPSGETTTTKRLLIK